jgi:MFS family permease
MSHYSTAAPSIDEKQRQPPPDIEKPPVDEEHIEPSAPTADAAPVSPWHPSQFPDGGKQAYLTLLGGFCCLFCSFGWLNCLGVFQNYYQMNQLRDYSPSTIAWIPSIQIFIMFIPGPVVGWVFDNYGPRSLLLFGTFFHVFGLMMASLCTEYYQFILAQAICSPLGLNCIFQAATSTIPTWFFNKRGLAYGVMAAGSGLGGIIFPIMASHLVPQVGFGWTMRIIAFTILALMIVANLTVSSRLPPRPRAFQLKVFVDPFKDMRVVLVTTSSFLFFMGLFIPINFIEVEAIQGGMSTRLAGYLLAILNAARSVYPSKSCFLSSQLTHLSIFGRIFPGALADKFGTFNMQSLWCTVAGILPLALAIPASNNATFIAFAALYGFASGAFVSLLPSQLAKISKVEEIGVRVGVTFACVSFAGLVGNPIAGAIVVANDGSFWGLNVFAGVMMLSGAGMFTLTRFYVAGWKVFAKV